MTHKQVGVTINVDDFGLHPAVNRAVIELGSMGCINSCSILANGPHLSEVSKIPNSVKQGAHLNILRGRPLSDPEKIPSLINPKTGLFAGDYKQLYAKYCLNQIQMSEVVLEWSAQIKYLQNLGIDLAHIDSEKHTHAWPKLAKIAIDLAIQNNIKRVRKPTENQPFLRMDKGGLRIKCLNWWCRSFPKSEKVSSPTVWGIADQGGALSRDLFEKYLEKNPNIKEIEVVVHPGNPYPEDPKMPSEFGSLRIHKQWNLEYNALKNQDWKHHNNDRM